MHNALYPTYDIDRQYESRKGGKGLWITEDCVDTSIQGPEYQRKTNYNKPDTTQKMQESTEQQQLQSKNRKKKQLCGYFKWQKNKTSHKKTWTWLKKGKLLERNYNYSNGSTKQQQKNKFVKSILNKMHQNTKYRLCCDRE